MCNSGALNLIVTNTPVNMDASTEHEIYVRYPISEENFNKYTATFNQPSEIILRYPNNVRIIQHVESNEFKFELKEHKRQTQHIFLVPRTIDNRIIPVPFHKTSSTEISLDPTTLDTSFLLNFDNATSIVFRYIISYQKSRNIRIAYELELGRRKVDDLKNGFFFHAEMEYDPTISHDKFSENRWDFFNIDIYDYINAHFGVDNSDFVQKLFVQREINELTYINHRTFAPFHMLRAFLQQTNKLVLKYKWDGYRLKIFKNNNQYMYIDDSRKIRQCHKSVIPVIEMIFTRFISDHLILQFEIVESNQTVVLVDIIGAYIYNNDSIFMPFTENVLEIFDTDEFKYLDNTPITIPGVCENYIFLVQKPLTTNMTLSLENLWNLAPHTDGLLILINDMEFKFKIPTIEARFNRPYFYIDGIPDKISYNLLLKIVFKRDTTSTQANMTRVFDKAYQNDDIHEIYLNNSRKFVSLKHRTDRKNTSSVEQFRDFAKDALLVLEIIQKHNKY